MCWNLLKEIIGWCKNIVNFGIIGVDYYTNFEGEMDNFLISINIGII